MTANPERGVRVTMKTMPDLMRRLRAGAALGRVNVLTSGHDVGDGHRGLVGLEPKVMSDGRGGHKIECAFRGGLSFSIPLTAPGFKPNRLGGQAAYYLCEGRDILITYVMSDNRVGKRYLQFCV